jgi:pyruvate/2-oxoglutarate dehydrogenase complex dihydrolipoamide acyltransferase (E2) component
MTNTGARGAAAHTPLIRAEASRRGVDLTSLRGTGAGGRVTLADVRAAAAPASVAPPVVDDWDTIGAPPEPTEIQPRHSEWGPNLVAVDPWHRNALAEEARQANPALYALASATEPAPTLFASGDLPPFTASGIDPRELLRLPWRARHAAAQEQERAAVHRIFEACTSSGLTHDDVDLIASEWGGTVGNAEYRQRIRNWLSGDTPLQARAHAVGTEPADLENAWHDSMPGGPTGT